MDNSIPVVWSKEVAEQTLEKFCIKLSIDFHDIELIRMGMNAIFHHKSLSVVIRVNHPSKTLQNIETEVSSAKFLEEQQFPTVSISDQFSDIYRVDQSFITVWKYLKVQPRPENLVIDFGSMLKKFHNIMSMSNMSLEEFNPLIIIKNRLEMLNSLSSKHQAVVDILNKELDELNHEFSLIKFNFDKGPIHGDAHTANIIWSNKKMYLLDYENVSFGERDYDLIPLCVIYKRFKPETDIDAFLSAYQNDLTLHKIDKRLIRIRELFMLSWLCQSLGQDKKSDNEIHHRIATLQAKEEDVLWHPM